MRNQRENGGRWCEECELKEVQCIIIYIISSVDFSAGLKAS